MNNSENLNLTTSFLKSILSKFKKDSNDFNQVQSNVLSILADSDEEQKPDKLKSYFLTIDLQVLNEQQLNQIILALLHQHRQDLNPSVSINKKSHSCSNSSDLININSIHQSKLLNNISKFQSRSPRTCSNSSVSSAPSSPPSSHNLNRQQTNSSHLILSNSNPSYPSINLTWSNKLDASALEFKPNLSRAVSLPFRPSSTHSNPIISPSIHTVSSNHLWAPQTLDQPHSPIQSPNNYPYHPHPSRPSTPDIPRDPWLRDDIDIGSAPIRSNGALSPNPFVFNSDEQDVSFDLFSPFLPTSPFRPPPLPPISTQSDENSQKQPSCPTALQWGLSSEMADEMAQFTAWDQSDSDSSLPPTIVHHTVEQDSQPSSLTHRYPITPFEKLTSILADTGINLDQIKQALTLSNFDTSKALDRLLEENASLIQSSDHSSYIHMNQDQLFKPSPSSRDSSPNLSLGARQIQHRFDTASLPTSPRFAAMKLNSASSHSPPSSSEKLSRVNLTTEDSSALDSKLAQRICRFYLRGCCLRSDCKFSHDVGKAICRFWLKGNCLKGENNCDFLHEIPESINNQQAKEQEVGNDKIKKFDIMDIKSFADEFPSLNESLLSNNRKSSHHNNSLKVSRLRPIALIPDRLTDPSPSLSKLCPTYSSQFLEFSSRSKECFNLAKECFKTGDRVGMKKWSKEGDQWNKKLSEEGRALAGLIITERNRLTKDAVRDCVSDRVSKVDEAADRMQRGKEMGGGICLGVIKPLSSNASTASPNLSVKERIEVLMDLHGLQPEDSVFYLEKFLLALKAEGCQGLAYVILTVTKAVESTTPSSSAAKNEEGKNDEVMLSLEEEEDEKRSKRLERMIKTWLDKKRFDWDSYPISLSQSKIVIACIDPLRKV